MKKIFFVMLFAILAFAGFEVGGYPSLRLKDMEDFKAKPQSNEYLKFDGKNWVADSITEGTDSVGYADSSRISAYSDSSRITPFSYIADSAFSANIGYNGAFRYFDTLVTVFQDTATASHTDTTCFNNVAYFWKDTFNYVTINNGYAIDTIILSNLQTIKEQDSVLNYTKRICLPPQDVVVNAVGLENDTFFLWAIEGIEACSPIIESLRIYSDGTYFRPCKTDASYWESMGNCIDSTGFIYFKIGSVKYVIDSTNFIKH